MLGCLNMELMKKQSAPKEVKAALGILDEASCIFDSYHGYLSGAFYLVRDEITELILASPAEVARAIRKGISPREWVYSAIANTAGDYVESGQYHIRRRHLNPTGEDLLRLFNAALDELVRIGAMEADYAEKEKSAILKSIWDAG